jgi:hypothetical protein
VIWLQLVGCTLAYLAVGVVVARVFARLYPDHRRDNSMLGQVVVLWPFITAAGVLMLACVAIGLLLGGVFSALGWLARGGRS